MPEQQSTVSWLGQSQNVMDLIGRFINIKEHKRSEAVNQLGGMMKMAEAGFVPDEKAFAKYMKQAGLHLPVPKTLEDMKALYGAMKDEKDGKGPGEGKGQGNADGQQTQQQQTQPTGGMPQGMEQNKFTQGLMDAQQKLSTGKPLTDQEHSQMYLNGIAARAVQLMNTNAATEQQKANNLLTVQNLHAQALAGDDKASGTLMRHGDVPFNFQLEQWSKLDETGRGRVLSMFQGYESDAQRTERASNIAQSLIGTGRVRNPADAFKAADALSRGQEVPAGIQMRSQSFKEMADQAVLASTLQEMGVPADQLGAVMRAADAGGLENALPAGLGRTFNERRLELEQQRVGLEVLRMQREVEIANKMAAAEARKGITDAQKAQLEEFKSYAEIAKAMFGKEGKQLPEDLRKALIDRTARALGMETEEVNTFWHFITGGTELKLKRPELSKESQSEIDKQIEGEPETVPAGVGKYLRGIQP
jgi:hypothetical protein